jgi:hypothetical protein
MNIIQIKIFLVILFCIVFSANSDSAQDSLIVEHVDKFYYELCLINSYSIHLDNNLDIKEKLYSPTIRFRWKPNRRLSLGLESGFVPILSENSKIPTDQGIKKFEGFMYGIPILVNFNYDFSFFYIFSGFGTSYINSEITGIKQSITSEAWAGTYNYGLGLAIPFARNFSIGIEAKGFYFTKIDELVAQAGINITYGFYGF